MAQLVANGVQIIAPPIWMLLESSGGEIVPSSYANAAKEAGLHIMTWTLERGSPFHHNTDGWYFQTLNGRNPISEENDNVVNIEDNLYNILHVLVQEVGVLGVFADWPATVSFYANCMNLK